MHRDPRDARLHDASRAIAAFFVLGVDLRLAGPASLVEPIATAYARFRTSYALQPDGAGDPVTLDGEPVPFVDGVDPLLLLYQHFTQAIHARLEGVALLHGASLVDAAGRVLLIAAPSGHGKSSLTLELLARGHRLLSDDYSPMDLATSTVYPYPRTIGLVPGGNALVPDAFRRAAEAPDAPKMFGKAILDVGRVLGESALANGSAVLGRVVLLTDDDPECPAAPGGALQVAALRDHAARIGARLAAIPGIRVVATGENGAMSRWLIEPDASHAPTGALSDVFDDPAIVFVERVDERRPDFTRPPAAAPVRRREAAEALAREMFNRRGGSRLLDRYGGRWQALFLDLAAALARASCWRVRPGPLAATADLIESLPPGAP